MALLGPFQPGQGPQLPRLGGQGTNPMGDGEKPPGDHALPSGRRRMDAKGTGPRVSRRVINLVYR